MATATEEKEPEALDQEQEQAATEEQAYETQEAPAQDRSEAAELLAEIVAQQDHIDEAKRRMDGLKEDLKEAREEWESLVEEQARIIRRQQEKYPLFDGQKKPADTAASPERWREASIDELRLPSGIESKLREAGIETIGQLEDKRAEGGAVEGSGLRSVSGIGPAKVSTIEDAVLAWLSANRDSWGQPVEEQSPNWRDTPIGQVATVYPVIAALKEAGIENLGQLADFYDSEGDYGLANIKGLGSEKAQSLMEAVAKYKTAHPELFPEGEEATA